MKRAFSGSVEPNSRLEQPQSLPWLALELQK